VRVEVDTSRGVYGSGSWGSRVSVVSGGAVVNAATAIAEKLRAIDGGRGLSLLELCELAYFSPRLLPAGMTPGLAAFESYALNPITTAPYAWHACLVELDTRTGELRIPRYAVVSDCGTVINPALLDGQIHGGIAQGLGEALFEEIEFDEHGVALQGDLFGYRAPRAADLPEQVLIRHIETPSPLNAFGIKGGGENGAIGAPGALAVALTDALWDRGYRVDTLPVRFAELARAVA
jgi:carbon-monoxide dehydrogenase large subunit